MLTPEHLAAFTQQMRRRIGLTLRRNGWPVNDADIADLVQETFYHLLDGDRLRSLRSDREEVAVAFACRAAENVTRDFMRGRRTRKRGYGVIEQIVQARHLYFAFEDLDAVRGDCPTAYICSVAASCMAEVRA